ncbi:glutamate ABC transporter substrate-binding protein [Lapillicoccus sp.]|uniref:glutamate ABC transporter substrate-binding protein n=1 Tax=Lapillicoccus sp. TaxID=1909287 RepID=UPI003264BA02
MTKSTPRLPELPELPELSQLPQLSSGPLSRRQALALLAGTGATLGLAACSSSGDASSKLGGGATASASSSAYEAIITSAPKADDATISGNAWAKAIKDRGTLRWGGTDANPLFSLLDPTTGKTQGFDAGMVQMLAQYIVGDSTKWAMTQVTVDTRETLIENNSVDVVVATYSITPKRADKVAFAGPYYASGSSIMVKADNTTITKVDDLVGKNVITESNSTAITALKAHVPSVQPILFTENAQCVAALKQGRGDAYVLDQSILLSTAVKDTSVKVVGEPFSTDSYGIGCSKSTPDAKAFINAWLKTMEDAGLWEKLWAATVGTVLKSTNTKPPAIAA